MSDTKTSLVYIILGAVNSGKTTKLLSIYDEIHEGDGFVLKKVYREECFIGQWLERLSTQKGVPFSYKRTFLPANWDEAYRYHDYSFSKRGLEFANKTVQEIITQKIEPVFIDEIGPLEIMGLGFADLFRQLLHTEKLIYVTVRDNCFLSVIDRFKLKDYFLVNIN